MARLGTWSATHLRAAVLRGDGLRRGDGLHVVILSAAKESYEIHADPEHAMVGSIRDQDVSSCRLWRS